MPVLLERRIICPYCGEAIDVQIDNSVSEQSYIEDCQVCCRPITLTVSVLSDDEVLVSAYSEDESF